MRVVVHPSLASSWATDAAAFSQTGSNPGNTARHQMQRTTSAPSAGGFFQAMSSTRSDMRQHHNPFISTQGSNVPASAYGASIRNTRTTVDLQHVALHEPLAAGFRASSLLTVSNFGGSSVTGTISGGAGQMLRHKGNGHSSPGAKEIAYIAHLMSPKEPGSPFLPQCGNGRSNPGAAELLFLASSVAKSAAAAAVGAKQPSTEGAMCFEEAKVVILGDQDAPMHASAGSTAVAGTWYPVRGSGISTCGAKELTCLAAAAAAAQRTTSLGQNKSHSVSASNRSSLETNRR